MGGVQKIWGADRRKKSDRPFCRDEMATFEKSKKNRQEVFTKCPRGGGGGGIHISPLYSDTEEPHRVNSVWGITLNILRRLT